MEEGLLKDLIALISFERIVSAALVVLIGWLLLVAVQFSLNRLAAHFPRYRLQIGQTFPVARVLVWAAVVAYIVFAIISPPEEVMFAVLGAVGLAVGLAAQDGIRNLLAGGMMIVNPPFRVGDMVRWGTHYGEVTRIDLSVTWLHTFNDDTIMVPNAAILTQPIVNSNSGDLAEMVAVEVDLPDTVPVSLVKELALDAARCSPYSYLKKPALVVVEPRFEYRQLLRFTIKAYVLDVRLERRLVSDITERLFEALSSHGLLERGGGEPAL